MADSKLQCLHTIVRGSVIKAVLRHERINVELSPDAGGQVDRDTLVSEVSRQIPNKLDLLFDREPADNGLENGADCHSVFADQAAVIDVGEDTHQEPVMLSAKLECEEWKIKHTGNPFDQSFPRVRGCCGRNP